MLTTIIVIDTDAVPNLIDELFVPRKLLRTMRPPPVRTLSSFAAHPIRVTGILLLQICLGDLRFRVWFEVIPNLATRVLLGTTFINVDVAAILQR